MAQQRQQQQMMGRGVSGLSEWSVVSEGELSNDGQHSLASEDSAERVILPGRSHGLRSASASASTLSSDAMRSCHNAAAAPPPPRAPRSVDSPLPPFASASSSSMTTMALEASDAPRARLLAAVSDLAADPEMNRVASEIYGGLSNSAVAVDQRLMDLFAQLAESLDDSQEKVKALLLQNDRLMSDNDELKRRLAQALKSDGSSSSSNNSGGSGAGQRQLQDDNGGAQSAESLRLSLAVAAGLLLISVAKKRLLLNPVGLLGAAFVGSCVGLYSLLQDSTSGAKEDEGRRRAH